MDKIYLDYGATTPVDERVIASMLPYFQESFGNPSSLHAYGQKAEFALENARRSIAANLGAKPSEIIFTSCGSESDNLALRGTAFSRREKFGYNRLLLSAIEHPAVLETANQLASHHGFEIDYLPVDDLGEIDYQKMQTNIQLEEAALVSVMGANNEIGTLNNLQKIVKICKEWQIPVHTDAVQSAAHYSHDLEELGVDLLSLGAHKFYGPKGVGVLYIRTDSELLPQMTGGSQEFGIRAATQNIPLIAGMAEAFRLVQEEGPERRERVKILRDRIIDHVLEEVPDSQLTGSQVNRLPNHASFVFKNVDGNLLIQVLDNEGFACSSGSACKTGDPKPSSVLTHLGYDPEWALGSLRVTLGKDTTQDQIERFLEILPTCIQRVREAAS
jgi:cysteine desulfurase